MLFFLSKRLQRSLKQHRAIHWLISLTVIFVGLFCLHWGAFSWFEGVSWEEGLWQTWQTFTTVGYGNRPAEGWPGRLVSMVFATLGIAVMGSLFAAAFDLKIYFSDMRRYGLMKNPFRQGYVVVHYPGLAVMQTFIEEIRSAEPEVGICILDQELDEIPKNLSFAENLHFIRGSSTDRAAYEQAGMRQSKAVIVFPPRTASTDPDATTKTIVHLIANFVDGGTTRLMHLLQDKRNAWMFEEEPSIQIFNNLSILSTVQECQDPYSSAVVEGMLLNTVDGNIVTIAADALEGWTWNQVVARMLILSARKQLPLNPISIIRAGKAMTCPNHDEKLILGDRLSLIAMPDFDWPETLVALDRLAREE